MGIENKPSASRDMQIVMTSRVERGWDLELKDSGLSQIALYLLQVMSETYFPHL